MSQQENIAEDFLKTFRKDENTKKIMTEYIKDGLMRISDHSSDVK